MNDNRCALKNRNRQVGFTPNDNFATRLLIESFQHSSKQARRSLVNFIADRR